MGGVLHGGIGVFSGNPLSEDEKNTIVEVLVFLWQIMRKKKVLILLVEPINGYESYVCNTAENVLELIEKTRKR